jgi:hypothetical protein
VPTTMTILSGTLERVDHASDGQPGDQDAEEQDLPQPAELQALSALATEPEPGVAQVGCGRGRAGYNSEQAAEELRRQRIEPRWTMYGAEYLSPCRQERRMERNSHAVVQSPRNFSPRRCGAKVTRLRRLIVVVC